MKNTRKIRRLDRLLYTLAGNDYPILVQCEKDIRYKYRVVGVLVLFIAFVSMIGVTHASIKTFDSLLIGVLIGLFFSLMIMNFYIFNLQTLTGNVLPVSSPVNRFANISIYIRYGFVMLIGFFVSIPINIIVQNPKIAAIGCIIQESAEIKAVSSTHSLDIFNDRKVIVSDMMNQGEKYWSLIRKPLFEDFTVITIIICSIVILLFFLPVFLKSIFETDDYKYRRKNIEKNMVLDEYYKFIDRYNEILLLKTGESYSFPELFDDPPFNTIKKPVAKPIPKSESSFINSIYEDKIKDE